jgi:hypothetical protein
MPIGIPIEERTLTLTLSVTIPVTKSTSLIELEDLANIGINEYVKTHIARITRISYNRNGMLIAADVVMVEKH